MDDLEGACHDAAGRALVIGSHNTDAGIDDTDRRKVVRFTLRSGRLHDVALRRDLRQDLLEALPAVRQAMRDGGKHDARLDIEALACDRRRDRLLIGLRSPREDERAMIVVLTNADAWFDDGAWWKQATASLAIVAAYLTLFAVCAQAIGAPLPALAVLNVVPLTLLSMLLPVSIGGWGLREAAAAALWPLVGLSAEAGVATSILYGLLSLAGSLPALGWLMRRA